MHIGDEMRNEHDETRRTIGRLQKADVAHRMELFPKLDKTLRAHFKTEEIVLVPQILNVPELKAIGQEIVEDHRATRILLDDLKEMKHDDPSWLVRLSPISTLLTSHFWKEENVVIPMAPEFFPMNALEALAKRYQEVYAAEIG